MADAKISALSDIVTLAAADKIAVADASDLSASKSATMTEVYDYLSTLALGSAQITALSAAGTAIANTDTLPIINAGLIREATFAQVWSYLFILGHPWLVRLGSDYTNNSTTGSEITGLQFAGIAAGTYLVQWTLFVQSAATTTSVKFGVNYTGTVTRMVNMAQFPSAGVTAVTGVVTNAANATTGQILAYANSTTESTTAPNLGPWTDFTSANVNSRIMIESLIVVSDGGDLELWAGSEVGGSTITVKSGSIGKLIYAGT